MSEAVIAPQITVMAGLVPAMTTEFETPSAFRLQQIAVGLDLRRVLVVDDLELELAARTRLPLAADQGRGRDIGHRTFLPLHRPDHRLVGRRRDRLADRVRLQRLGALEDVGGDLEQRMLEAERHGPGLVAGLGVGGAKLGRRLAGQVRREGMVRRPPNLDRDIFAERPERAHRGREFRRLAGRHDLRLEALLGGLRPEAGECRRRQYRGDDLAASRLESRNLRGEVFRERVEAAGIDRLVAALGEHRRHAVTGVAERVAVGIVRL
jgi:hypothetical protein